MKKLLLIISLIFVSTQLSFGQQRIVEKIEINQKPKSITTAAQPEVSPITNSFVREVFRDCPDAISDRKRQEYDEVLKRTKIISINDVPQEAQLLSLSSRILRTKCNADLVRDNASTFDEDQFNPLKYIINFRASENQYFLIDGTEKVLFIQAFK